MDIEYVPEFLGRRAKRGKPLSQHTQQFYRVELTRFLQTQPITAPAIEAWTNAIEASGKRPEPFGRAIFAFCRFLVRRGYLPGMPDIAYLKRENPARPLPSKDEWTRLLAACKGKPRSLAALLLATDTGARRAELAAMTWDDVADRTIQIRHGKGDQPRQVYITPVTLRALEAIRDGPSLLGLAEGGLASLFRRLGDHCGLDLSSHRLRRYALTNLAEAGMPIPLLMQISGHRRVETLLDCYIHPSTEAVQTAHDKFSPLAGLEV